MTKAVQKITLSPSRDIPFNKLVLSQSNVRRVKAGVSIEQLAESIAQRTLLQSLNVRAVTDAEGNETGMFEVPAGGRRYRALELLVKQKRMAKTQAVPCVVREGGIAEDDSLAENDERMGLHPLDQFRAFQTLSGAGMSEEEIAARHFVAPAVVKQRLRLASISPKLHDVYAEDGMTLEQLMAFSVTADHARQEQVWENVSRSGYDEPYQIRRMLTENTVRASDRRVQFIGLDVYEQAGGGVVRDLFEHDDGGWLQDVALLDRLVTEKLKAEAEAIGAEGWKWISVAVDFPYGHTTRLRELEGQPVDLTSEEQATIDALNAEQAKLETEYQDADELPEEVDQRLGAIEAALLALEDRPETYDPAEIAGAGVFVSIDSEGRLCVDRGYVRPEDEVPAADFDVDPGADVSSTEGPEAGASVQRAAISVAGASNEQEEDDEDPARPLPDRLIIELTAHRTLALRDALAENPAVAFQAVLHNFVLTAFYRFASSASCLEIGLRTPTFPAQAPGLRESVSAKAVEVRHEAWKARLPKGENDLWDALTALDGDAQASLFAHCASFAVNAVHEPANRYNQGRVSAHGVRTRLDQANVLARAAGLDMVQAGWRPTIDNYLGRVTKPRILEAVREAKGDSSAQLIEHLKKSDMAKEEFPHARHMSFNAYDGNGQPVDRINDALIKPEEGAPNPFLAGAARNSPHRRYTISIVPRDVKADTRIDDRTRTPNTLFVTDEGGVVQLWYRIYVADKGRDARGGVALPEPLLIRDNGGVMKGEELCREIVKEGGAVRDVKVPANILSEMFALPGRSLAQPAQAEPKWDAFFNPPLSASRLLIGTEFEPMRDQQDKTRTGGFYSTIDNTYMSMYVDNRLGNVLVMRGRVPTTPRTYMGATEMEAADLRYWSICKYRSLADTAVDSCLYDEQVPRDPSGVVTIVMSKPEDRPANARSECGVAWLPWGIGDGIGNPHGGFLGWRHMMPSEQFRPRSIFATTALHQEEAVLGEYHPKPRYTTREAFEKEGCAGKQ